MDETYPVDYIYKVSKVKGQTKAAPMSAKERCVCDIWIIWIIYDLVLLSLSLPKLGSSGTWQGPTATISCGWSNGKGRKAKKHPRRNNIIIQLIVDYLL